MCVCVKYYTSVIWNKQFLFNYDKDQKAGIGSTNINEFIIGISSIDYSTLKLIENKFMDYLYLYSVVRSHRNKYDFKFCGNKF